MTAATSTIEEVAQPVSDLYLPLKAGTIAQINTIAAVDTSDQTVKPAVSGSTTLLPVGRFAQFYDNSEGSTSVTVRVKLFRPIPVQWFQSATGSGAITSSNLFSNVYLLDNQTLTATSSGNSVAGRVFMLDAIKGVGISPVVL
jgi:hypothetical protein